MKFNPNNLFNVMYYYYITNKDVLDPSTRSTSRINICNEGSSRSSKTFDTYHLLVKLCSENKVFYGSNNKPLNIYVYRSTLKDCREIAFKVDFKECMNAIGIWDDNCATGENQSPEYNLWGNIIRFRGMDGGAEKGKSDIVFYNEILDENDERSVKDLLLRCERLFIADWNPKYSYHWIFEWEGRFNTLFTKTTWRNNKHLSSVVRNSIMESCPWDFEDWDDDNNCWRSPEELRPRNERNYANRTVDRWRWLVYGEGKRCPADGNIYTTYDWVDEFPASGFDEVGLAIDFGFTNDPTVLVRAGRSNETLTAECMSYEPTGTPLECFKLVSVGLQAEEDRRRAESGMKDVGALWIFCDSADKNRDDEEYVITLNNIAYANGKNWNFVKTGKIGIRMGIDIVKLFDLRLVKNKNVQIEIENYCNKVIEGRVTNIPIDKNNHFLDALRYLVVDAISYRPTKYLV
jgi:hypothetical protein